MRIISLCHLFTSFLLDLCSLVLNKFLGIARIHLLILNLLLKWWPTKRSLHLSQPRLSETMQQWTDILIFPSTSANSWQRIQHIAFECCYRFLSVFMYLFDTAVVLLREFFLPTGCSEFYATFQTSTSKSFRSDKSSKHTGFTRMSFTFFQPFNALFLG